MSKPPFVIHQPAALFFCVLGIELSTLLFASVPCRSQTIDQALAMAYEINPTLLAERAELRATDEHVSQARSGWRPTVAIQAEAAARHSAASEAPGGRPNPLAIGTHSYPRDSYGLTVSQPLYRGGRTVAATAEAEADVNAERAHLQSIEQSVLLAVATDYLDVVLNQQLVEIAVDHHRAMAAEQTVVKHLFTAGIVTTTDVAEADTALVAAMTARRQVEAALESARTSFRRDAGIEAQKLKPPQIDLPSPESRDQALAIAASANPDLMAAEYTIAAKQQAIDVARGQLLPSVNLVASVGHASNYPFDGRREDAEAIGIELSIPLYDAGTSHSQVRQAEQSRSAQARRADAQRAAAVAAAGTAWDRLQAAIDSVDLSRKAKIGNEAIVTGMQKEFGIGKRSVREVLDAADAALRARIGYAQAERDVGVARFVLAAAVGQLTAKNLALPVQYYDVAAHYDAVRSRWFGFGDEN